jgi:hypothetical protein
MARALTVKVATPKIINALETKLAKIEKDYLGQTESEAKFQEDWKAYQDALTAYAIVNISKAENFRTSYRSWNSKINIDYDVPTGLEGCPDEPKRDFTTMAEYEYRNAKEEITNALNILKMTEDEFVNASTMKAIASYL